MNKEVVDTSMATVLNLGDILELVMDCFDKGALAQHEFVPQWHQPRFHVAANAGNKLDVLLQQLFKQGLGEIAFVTKQLAEQGLDQ